MYCKAGARWWRSYRVESVDRLYRFGASQDPHKGVGSLVGRWQGADGRRTNCDEHMSHAERVSGLAS